MLAREGLGLVHVPGTRPGHPCACCSRLRWLGEDNVPLRPGPPRGLASTRIYPRKWPLRALVSVIAVSGVRSSERGGCREIQRLHDKRGLRRVAGVAGRPAGPAHAADLFAQDRECLYRCLPVRARWYGAGIRRLRRQLHPSWVLRFRLFRGRRRRAIPEWGSGRAGGPARQGSPPRRSPPRRCATRLSTRGSGTRAGTSPSWLL